VEALQRKQCAAQPVIFIQHTGKHDDIGKIYHHLYQWADAHNATVAGPAVAVFLSSAQGPGPAFGRFEVCLPVSGEVCGDQEVAAKELPACTVAYATVKGPYQDIPAHYEEMLAWMAVQGLEPSGPPREVYLQHPDAGGGGDPAELITEMQFPIEPNTARGDLPGAP